MNIRTFIIFRKIGLLLGFRFLCSRHISSNVLSGEIWYYMDWTRADTKYPFGPFVFKIWAGLIDGLAGLILIYIFLLRFYTVSSEYFLLNCMLMVRRSIKTCVFVKQHIYTGIYPLVNGELTIFK